MGTIIQIRKHPNYRLNTKRVERDRIAIRAWNRSVLVWILHEEAWEPLVAFVLFVLAFLFFYHEHVFFGVAVATAAVVISFVQIIDALCDYVVHRFTNSLEEDSHDDEPPNRAA